MAGKYVTFRVSEVFWPRIRVGHSPVPGDRPAFGLLFKEEDLPESLRSYVKPIVRTGESMIQLREGNAPFLSLTGTFTRAAALLCARDSLVDTLLTKIPLDLCVEPIEFEAPVQFGSREYVPGDTVRMLELVAVRASLDDMMRRYDEISAHYFEG